MQRLLNFVHDAHRVGRTSTIRKRLREQVGLSLLLVVADSVALSPMLLMLYHWHFAC